MPWYVSIFHLQNEHDGKPISRFFGAMGSEKQWCSEVINAVVAPITLGEKLTCRRSRD
jgi:hypothetical protein